MLHLFKKYNTVIRFIFIFLGSYFVFSLFYNGYLVFFRSAVYYPDYITHLVAKQSESLIKSLGYAADIRPHQTELSMKLYVNRIYLARIVEGCNAISIMILFSSFILAFFGKIKLTILYILTGSVLIYAMNIIRIALLAVGIYEYPEYASFFHSILFPLVIYGTVFLLWVIWVRIYSNTRKV